MKIRVFFIVLFAFLFSNKNTFAQLEKANYYYNNFYYTQAIPYYIKATKKEKTKIEATQKLAHCYLILRDFKNAEKQYEQVIENDNFLPIHRLYYGQMLLSNGHVNAAKEQFTLFSEASGEDKRSQNLMSSILITRLWSVKQREHDVQNVKSLNSKGAEFCAVPYNGKIVFVSDRGRDFVNYSKSSIDNKPYLSLFLAERGKGNDSTKFNKTESFSSKINNEYHNGPASFVESGRQIFFTRVDKKIYAKTSDVINRPKIYYATKIKDSWEQVKPFAYNNEGYSVAHPAISADGTVLIFSSDMPGGFGGKDLYMCKLEGANWSKPINLGPKINSLQDEVFPYLHKNGTLYFSSDGHIGFGGLDIYSARYSNNEWGDVKNMQEPINSSFDDFGVSFLFKTESGYFSSNRPGGFGGDDIYFFDLLKKAPKVFAISGRMFQNELDAAKNIEVKLIDEKGVVLEKTKTDSAGFFKFSKLNAEEDYTVLLNAEEIEFNNKGTSFFHGHLFYNENIPANKVRLVIKNKAETLVKEIETDQAGYFRFDYLDYDENNLNKADDSETAFVKKELFKYQQLTTDNIIPSNLDNEETIAKLKKLFKYDELLASNNSINTEELEDANFYVKNGYKYNKLTGDSVSLESLYAEDNNFYVKNGYRYSKLTGDSVSLESLYAEDNNFYVKNGYKYSKLTGDSIALNELTLDDVNFSFSSYTIKLRLFTGNNFTTVAQGVKVTIKDGNGIVYKEVLTDEKGEIKVNFLPNNRTFVIKVDQDNDAIQQNDFYSVLGRVISDNSTKYPIKGKEISLANSTNALFSPTITEEEGFFKIVAKTEKRVNLNLLASNQDSLAALALNDENTLRKKTEQGIKFSKLSSAPNSISTLEISDEDILKKYGNKSVANLEFTVQIAAYNIPQNFNYKKIEQKFGEIKIQKLEDNITRFTVQSQATINEAEVIRQQLIKEGVTDAFITGIYQGKRYLLRELIKLGVLSETEENYFKEVDKENKPKDEKANLIKPLKEVKTTEETSHSSLTTTKKTNTIKPEKNIEKLVDEYGDVITEKIEYRVQVGAFRLIPSSYHYKRLQEVGEIDKKQYPDGIVRYTIGHCETLREADKIRRQVVKVGTLDAFIVVIYKGNRYTIYEAIQKEIIKK